MGSKVCKKCGIREDSPYIIDNNTRRHCRIHNFKKKGDHTFFCKDCGDIHKNYNCRHRFKFKLCCFTID